MPVPLSLAVQERGTVEHQMGYGYDTATGYLSTVTGLEIFTYSYAAGSSLIAGVTGGSKII